MNFGTTAVDKMMLGERGSVELESAQDSASDSLCAAVCVLHRTVRVTACVQLLLLFHL